VGELLGWWLRTYSPRLASHPSNEMSSRTHLLSSELVALPLRTLRPVRFHDLRHTTATLLLRSGVPLVVVQKMLRHRDPKLTEATYGHLATNFLRTEVNAAAGAAQGPSSRSWPCHPRVTHSPRNAEGAGAAREKPERLRPLQRVGETGFEPATPWSRRAVEDFQGVQGRPSLRKLSGFWGCC
jgi:hypothetical protein